MQRKLLSTSFELVKRKLDESRFVGDQWHLHEKIMVV